MAAGSNMGRVGAREIVAVDEGERARHGHSMRMLRVMTPQTSNVWPSETRMSAYSDLKYSKEYGKEARLPPSASSGV